MTRQAIALALMTVAVMLSVAPRRLVAQDAEAAASAKAARVVEQLVAGQTAAVVADFAPAMAAALPEARLRDVWASVIAQAGAFRRQAGVKTQPAGPAVGVIVSCEFEHAWVDIQIGYNAQGQIAGLFFRPGTPVIAYSPPSYVTPGRFTEQDVTVGVAPWVLPGTLTLPTGDGPFPAVVLVHGSGPGDRDESVGPNKSFRDLALGLASQGIAVLRYDKRTRVYPAQSAAIKGFTVKDEVIDDALAAVDLLRHQAKVDPRRIVVAGHSLGGMVAPRIGNADARIAGLIVLAGNTRQIDVIAMEQGRYMAQLDGVVTPQEQAALDQQAQMLAPIARLTAADADSPALILNAPASYWLDLRPYDPPAVARTLTQPMLILQGERDFQVTMTDFIAWKSGLATRSNVTFKSYPALNHLLIAGTGPGVPQEYNTVGHVDADLVGDVARWILALAPAASTSTR